MASRPWYFIDILQLYKNVFSPDIGSSLAFIGFVQEASGSILSMSETQAMWFSELCKKHIQLPKESEMISSIDQEKVLLLITY